MSRTGGGPRTARNLVIGLRRVADGGTRGGARFVPILLPLLVLASPAWSQVAETTYGSGGALDVAVDSLPFVLERIWGLDSDRPYTAMLGADRIERTGDGSAASSPFGELGTEQHPTQWLDRQEVKAHVVGTCAGSIDEGDGCRREQATMVVWLSPPLPREDGSVVVEILLARRGDDGPGRPQRFRAGVALTLEEQAAGWEVTDLALLWIT